MNDATRRSAAPGQGDAPKTISVATSIGPDRSAPLSLTMARIEEELLPRLHAIDSVIALARAGTLAPDVALNAIAAEVERVRAIATATAETALANASALVRQERDR